MAWRPSSHLDEAIRSSIRGLMLSDNLGDVHEEIDRLRAAVDLPALEGDFLSGWDAVDWEGTGSDE